MELLQVAGSLLIGILWLLPIIHIVKSQYWSKHAKAVWIVAFFMGNFFSYTIFLIATFRKAQHRNQELGLKENKFSSWLIWLFVFVGNGFLAYLWVVFSLARPGSPIILGTELGVTIPLLVSIYFMLRERYSIGLACIASVMPLVLGFSLLLDIFNKP